MRCVLAHCLGVEGLTWQERSKTVSCLGSFFYRDDTPPRGLAAGVDFSGLPTDPPVNLSRGAVPLLQHRGPDAQDHPRGLSQLPAALHRHDGLSCQQGTARRARRGQRQQGHRERGRGKRAREAHAHGQGCAKAQGQGQGRAKTGAPCRPR